jgi:acetyl-CoA synthetase
MLKKKNTYDEVYKSFRWRVPKKYNIGVDICDKWADERYRLALIYEDEDGKSEKFTFWDLKGLSNRLANALKAYGIEQETGWESSSPVPETALTWPSIKLGGIAIPLFTLFGPMPWNTA